MLEVVEEGDNPKRAAFGTVEEVDQDDPGEPLKVGEAVAELGEDLDQAAHPGGPGRLDRHAGRVGERRANAADRPNEDAVPTIITIHTPSPSRIRCTRLKG